MSSFLGQLADYLIEKHNTSSIRIRVILPTKRSVFFLKKELSRIDALSLKSIDAQSIEEFISSTTTIELADQVNLLFTLYQTYKEVEPSTDFDRFMGWAPVMLEDFDRIDLHNIDSDYLFDYLTESKALERWELQLPPGKTLHKKDTGLHYFTLFEKIRQVYKAFKIRLAEQGKGYRGMAYRELSDRTQELLIDSGEHDLICFAGFNAFTESERLMIRKLVKYGKGEVIWDTDHYYMELNREVEAGEYLRNYRTNNVFGKAWNWMGDDLVSAEKSVKIYGVPNAVLQAKLAGQIYQQSELKHPGVKTAIVLADENLLLPVLCSLPAEVTDFNVTMGLSLRHSLLYSLVEEIFELHQQAVDRTYKEGGIKYGNRSVARLLNHTYVRQYLGLSNLTTEREIADKVLEGANENLFFTPSELLHIVGDVKLFQLFFKPWQKGNSNSIIEVFADIGSLFRERFSNNGKFSELVYFDLFDELLKEFRLTLSHHTETISSYTFRTFLMEMLRQKKIPFGGDQSSDLQIVGMLETRALDFDRIIILSLNEGVLPKNRQNDSLIPIDIATEVGIPVFRQQEAIMSYHFYRLLQRCNDIHLIYTNTENAPGGAEKSRFIRQLEFEWPQYNPHVKLENITVNFPESEVVERIDYISKDEIVLAKIKEYLTKRGVYPTHLNTLINDPMEFYLRYIARVKVEDEMADELGMDKIGLWLHATLEALDQKFFLFGETPGDDDIKGQLSDSFTEAFGQYNVEFGLNRLYYLIGEQQIMAFLKHQIDHVTDRKTIAAEQLLDVVFPININGEELPIKLAGKIDRIECTNEGKLLIIDYKTGSVNMPGWSRKSPEEMDNEIMKSNDFKVGYARQLWFYQLLMCLKMQSEKGLRLGNKLYDQNEFGVEAAFYSFRRPTELIGNPYPISDDPEVFLDKSKELLSGILSDLLNKDIPFVRSANADERRSGVYEGLVSY